MKMLVENSPIMIKWGGQDNKVVLKEAYLSLGRKQTKIGEAVGVPQPVVSRIFQKKKWNNSFLLYLKIFQQLNYFPFLEGVDLGKIDINDFLAENEYDYIRSLQWKENQSIEDLPKVLGARIDFFRKAKKIEKKILAEQMGVKTNSVDGWVKGNRMMTYERLLRLANCLETPIWVLLYGFYDPAEHTTKVELIIEEPLNCDNNG